MVDKTYSIVRIAGIHSFKAIESIYEKSPECTTLPFAEQQKLFFDQELMYSNSFQKELSKLGYNAHEILYDVEILQKKWAKENNITFNNSNWKEEIVLEQLRSLSPEIVFFQDIHSLRYEIKKTLKELVPSIKWIIIFRGYPGITYNLHKELSTADLLLVGSPILQQECSRSNLKSHLFYHFFDEQILQKISSHEKKWDFSFVGSSGYGYKSGHIDRYEMLLTLLKKTNITLWIDEPFAHLPIFSKKTIKIFFVRILKKLIKFFPLKILKILENTSSLSSKFKRIFEECITEKLHLITDNKKKKEPNKPISFLHPEKCKKPVFGIQMYQKLAESKIVLNKHSTPAKNTVDNIRLFQVTGVGSCLLTDHGKNLTDLFIPDEEVVTYSSLEECLEKIKYLQENPKARDAIAIRGQKKTLSCHTATMRYAYLHELIQKLS